MYLYMDGERYVIRKDMTSKNISGALVEILQAINDIRIPASDIEEKFMRFMYMGKHGTFGNPGIADDAYPYLQKCFKKGVMVGGRLKEVEVSSLYIFKEAYMRYREMEWHYVFDYSYQHIVHKQFFPDDLPGDTPKKPLLVPKTFLRCETLTYITDEVITEKGQPIISGTLKKNV